MGEQRQAEDEDEGVRVRRGGTGPSETGWLVQTCVETGRNETKQCNSAAGRSLPCFIRFYSLQLHACLAAGSVGC